MCRWQVVCAVNEFADSILARRSLLVSVRIDRTLTTETDDGQAADAVLNNRTVDRHDTGAR